LATEKGLTTASYGAIILTHWETEMNEELNTLEELLARHDWFYDRSDDYSAWTRGQNESRAIQAEKNRLARECRATQEEIVELDALYRPKNI
jgi:hypothetical protein